jgi:membrane fusion protein, multidrug efflux system
MILPNNSVYDPFVKWRTVLVALFCGLSLTACKRQVQAPPAVVPEVATVTVARQQVALTTELPGHTSPYRIAEIRPQVNGLILKRLFTEGSDVKEGQELYQIDPAPFQAALDNAKAALGRAEANVPAIQSRVDRYKQALADKAVSQQDFDDADAALKQAEAALETARINLNYTHIVSPISGRIGKSTVTDGAIVTAYQPMVLATIQQLNPIYVDVPQSATDLLRLEQRLKAGQIKRAGTNVNTVRLILPDGSHYSLEGTLAFRDISVDPTTGSVILRMLFPNPDGVLLPSMFVRGVVQEGVNDQAILVPQQTVARDPKGNPVAMVVSSAGTVEQRQLTLDRAIGDQWLVTSGLEVGDQVIAEGIQKVRPGAPVKVVPFGKEAKPGTPAHPAGATQPAVKTN